jgi:hypothetical protein
MTERAYSNGNYLQNIAEHVYSAYRTHWLKIGYNGDVDNAEEDMISQGGTYVWPSTAQQMDIVSSTSDDVSGGSGVRTVTLYYLTTTGLEKSEIITMNGVTAQATTATDIYRVNNMRVTTAGAGGKASGNITLSEHSGTTYKYGYIAAGYTRMRQCVYTVPLNKTLYITSIVCAGANTSSGHWVRFTFRATYDDKSHAVLSGIFVPYFEAQMVDQSFYRPLEIPLRFPTLTDLKVSALSDASGANELTSCSLRGYFATPLNR